MPPASPKADPFPDQPVLVRLWRGGRVESQHRGAWVLVDPSGAVLDGAGDAKAAVFARSAVKSLQALPLLESGAAERFDVGERELALALASHEAEAQHLEVVRGMLARAGLRPEELRCGPQPPGDAATRAELRRAGLEPAPLHNNCSGKHAGFLTLARHLGQDPATYLEPEGLVQRRVRRAVLELSGVPEESLETAVDGCSAPTFRLPLTGLATAFARVANPAGLGAERERACQRMQRAVAGHPELIAGRRGRLCTALARAGAGRLFPKIGAEGIYGLGLVGGARALAVKIDDGGLRALNALVVALVEHLGWLDASELSSLAAFRGQPLRNWAGLEVGTTEVLL
jgi:L-asparaginase II